MFRRRPRMRNCYNCARKPFCVKARKLDAGDEPFCVKWTDNYL